ncbi:MAG: carbohydrate ABC transporter permease [Bacilli bacterium]|nr:carbohydrate ABC transporter permease [Bacilli bacterium]
MIKKKNLLPNSMIKESKSVMNIIIFVVLIVYFLSLLIPIIWAVYTAFNDIEAYYDFYAFNGDFPTKLVIDNFRVAFTQYEVQTISGTSYNFLEMTGISLIYTLGCAFFYTLTPTLVAYAAARFKFKFSSVIYAFVIIAMALPIVGSMPSEIKMLKQLNLFDSFFGMFILRMNFLSINFLILYAQFEMIPMTYSEAAKVDGASNFRIMTQVILPQAISTITTIFLLSFITFWNDYQIPRIYLPSYPTLAEGLFTFSLDTLPIVRDAPVKLAGFIGLTLPIVIVFGVLNKKLRINVATGGIKG